MSRAILFGASTLVAYGALFACSSSGGAGPGDASSGAGGVAGFGGNTNTSGAAGAAASSGTGGFIGSGGSGGVNAGGSSGGVSPGKVTIEFTATGPTTYCTTMACLAGPPIDIKDAAGHSLFSVTASCSDVACETCQTSPCPGYYCPPPSGVVVTGSQMEWDGSYYENSTCGAGTSCVRQVYANPGKYTATFCATPGKLVGPDGGAPRCVTSGPAKCGSIDFDFPSSTVAKGTVGP